MNDGNSTIVVGQIYNPLVRFTTVFIMKHCLRIRGDLHSDANCYSIVQSCVPIPFQVFPTSSQHTREQKKSADRHIGEEGVAKFLNGARPAWAKTQAAVLERFDGMRARVRALAGVDRPDGGSLPSAFFHKMNDLAFASRIFFALVFSFTHFSVRLFGTFSE